MTSDQSLAGLHPLWIEKTIHNTVYTIKQTQATMQATMQVTRLNIHGFTTSDQSLAGSHTFRTLKTISLKEQSTWQATKQSLYIIKSKRPCHLLSHTQNYCLRAENPCLSARCLFSHLGKEKDPSVHPGTGQGKGPLCEATCSRIILRTLNNFSPTGQVHSFVVGGGPCFAFM